MTKIKYMSVQQGEKIGIDKFPNFHVSGNIESMKEKYYGKDALLVQCGRYIYNVTSDPEVYKMAH